MDPERVLELLGEFLKEPVLEEKKEALCIAMTAYKKQPLLEKEIADLRGQVSHLETCLSHYE